MENTNIHGSWKNRKVLFIGDSLTARRIYPKVIQEIIGIEPYYHCKGGAGLKGMVDGENGIGAKDALEILKYSVGNIFQFPIEE